MALSYLDYSDDHSFRDKAHDVLKSTTYVSLQDMIPYGNYFRCKNKNSIVQQSCARMGYNECKKRGIAEPEWSKYDDKILLFETTLNGEVLFAFGVTSQAKDGVGDAPWLCPLWWYGVVDKSDPRMLPSYNNSAKSKTGDYIFNNGTMGVIAAKLGLGNQALSWLQNFQKPDVLYDDVCFAETRGNHFLTPEIGAHGAFICNLSQMLIDPDSEQQIDIFPAIPKAWDSKPVGFNHLMAKGGLSISAGRDTNQVFVEIKNQSAESILRNIRIKIPEMRDVAETSSGEVIDGFIFIPLDLPPGETRQYEYHFLPSTSIQAIAKNRLELFPNPNTTGIIRIPDDENINGVYIHNLSGQLAAKLQKGSVCELDNGIYLVFIKTKDNQCIWQNLIVKKYI